MMKIILGCLCLTSSLVFAQAPNLQGMIDELDKTLINSAQKDAGANGKIGYFIHTKDNQFIRIQSITPNGRGLKINQDISQKLLSQGSYEGQNVENQELGVKCKLIHYQFDKEKNLGVVYGEGCEKMN